jgi:hypothetical protein
MPFNKSPWAARIPAANKYYNEWENTFKCKMLDKYVEGFQWTLTHTNYLPYTLNLIYYTIKVKLANILYQSPTALITANPSRSDWNPELAFPAAALKQDIANAILQNPNLLFVPTSKLAALDSFTRFGIIETGYAADWGNPHKTPLITAKYNDPDSTSDRVINDIEVPVNERVFFKHIRANRFRVSANDAFFLKHCSWCGYYEFLPRTTLEKTKGIKIPDEYKVKYSSADYGDIASTLGVERGSAEFYSKLFNADLLKVWKIWDNYNKEKLLILDSGNYEVIWKGDFERLPFNDLRWDFRQPSGDDAGWYPIPLAWQWISPQDEINRSREQMRRYRARFTRKFEQTKGRVAPEELEKFTNEIDGEIIEVKEPNAIRPIGNPEIGISIAEALNVSLNDINIITGVSIPARGGSDRETATAARIGDLREQIRESVEQLDFSSFLVGSIRESVLIFQERFVEGIWAKVSGDPPEPFLGEVQAMKPVYNYITAQDISDGYDMDIEIAINNATPARLQEQEMKFIKFLTIVKQFPEIALDPSLIREAAYVSGYRNETVIKKMQQLALLNMFGRQSAQGGGPDGQNANNTAMQVLNANPNPQVEVDTQLAKQIG